MDCVPLFLNENSYPISADDVQLAHIVRNFIQAIYDAKDAAGDIYLGSEGNLSDIHLNERFDTLASVLRGRDIEWWRFIRSIDQRSPYSAVPQSVSPPEGVYVDPATSGGGQGLLWAYANESFLLSFASSEEWMRDVVYFFPRILEEQDHGASVPAEVRHLSLPGHASKWADSLRNFKYSDAVSSAIFEGDSFSLKMYLNDHNPPHVHVYVDGLAVALVRFDRGPEVLRGRGLKGVIQTSVFRLLSSRRDDLMASWERCRAGERPFKL